MSFKYAASGLDHQHHIPLVPPSSLTYFYVFLLLLLLLQQSHAGCYHCCAGRNSSCKSTEDTLSQMRPDSQRGRIKLLEMRAGEQFPPVFTENNEKIGRLILPDMVELQGKGKSEYLRIFEEFTEWQEEHFFIFGTEIEDQSDTEKLVSHQKGRPLISLAKFVSMHNNEMKLRKHRRDRSDCMSIVEANNVSAALNEMLQVKSAMKAVSQERSGESPGQQPARPQSQSYQRMTKQNLQSKSRSPSSSIQEDSSSEKSYDSGSISEEALSDGQCQCKCGGCPCYNRGCSLSNIAHSPENSFSKFSSNYGDKLRVESERRTSTSMPNLELGNNKPLPDYETLGNNASVDGDSISSGSDAARQTRSMMNVRHPLRPPSGEQAAWWFGVEIRTPTYLRRKSLERDSGCIKMYSLLNKHVPLKVGKVKRIATPPPTTSQQHSLADSEQSDKRVVLYLSDSTTESAHCYCDEFCVKMGDCCADYSFVCPPADCQVSSWSRWSVECVSSDRCGSGIQQRNRLILGHPSNGGAKCPGLDESRGCFKDCSTRPPLRIPAAYYDRSSQIDITTVALLLDYQYNSSRVDRPLGYANSSSSRSNGSTHWRHFDKQLDKSKHTYYCVHYELGWVNRNCVERKWKSKLSRKKVICAECQPEAQLHRNSPRCASDLEDGDKGFWKLIGPPSCSGIWRRISRTNDCKCFEKYPSLTPFLLV